MMDRLKQHGCESWLNPSLPSLSRGDFDADAARNVHSDLSLRLFTSVPFSPYSFLRTFALDSARSELDRFSTERAAEDRLAELLVSSLLFAQENVATCPIARRSISEERWTTNPLPRRNGSC